LSTTKLPLGATSSNVRLRAHARLQAHGQSIAPVLDAPDSRSAAALARLTGRGHPVRTFFAGILISYLSIALLSILLGLFLTDVLLKSHGIASADERFVAFLAHRRDGSRTEASLLGSIVAGGVVLPVVIGGLALLAATLRQWRVAGLFVFALAMESAVYRTTIFFVHRHRPDVHRLEQLPVNASYPSGHTAASIAVYCGIALLLTSMLTRTWQRVAIWAVAAAIPLYVACSRMYRGMHHPLDCLGSVVVGVCAIVALVLCCRATGIAARERSAAEGR
jgi:membrane-associated phospholipid phosphatase